VRKPKGLNEKRASYLREKFPLQRQHFTDADREALLNRLTEHEHAIFKMTVYNFKLVNAGRTWVRKRFPHIAIVARMYTEYNHIVAWLESR